MDRQRLFGREIEVEFAKGIRKSKYFVIVVVVVLPRKNSILFDLF